MTPFPFWLEPLAACLAVVMVLCNVLRLHWGWGFAVASSALYAWVFAAHRLYADAALQGFFIVLALYGWWQWCFQKTHKHQGQDDADWKPKRIRASQGMQAAAWWLPLWAVLAELLHQFTNSDAVLMDSIVTSLSIVATVFLANRYTINWAMWLIVNLISVALFIRKELWLTAVLYLFLAVMSVVGWRQWRKRQAT